MEELISRDRGYLFTLASLAISVAIYVNLAFVRSPFLGVFALILYFLINAIFLGHAVFGKEIAFLRMVLGALLLIMVLGFLGWAVIIAYNLDELRFTIVLLMATAISSLVNRVVRREHDSK